MTTPKRGQVFVHDHYKDLNWVPASGQKWKDAPYEKQIITKVTSRSVYFRALDGKGSSVLPLDKFMERFGSQL